MQPTYRAGARRHGETDRPSLRSNPEENRSWLRACSSSLWPSILAHCPAGAALAGAFNESFQWERKNFFWAGKNVSDFPTIGRKAVVIWTATRMKMITHV